MLIYKKDILYIMLRKLVKLDDGTPKDNNNYNFLNGYELKSLLTIDAFLFSLNCIAAWLFPLVLKERSARVLSCKRVSKKCSS